MKFEFKTPLKRIRINILLILLNLILGGVAVWITRRPTPLSTNETAQSLSPTSDLASAQTNLTAAQDGEEAPDSTNTSPEHTTNSAPGGSNSYPTVATVTNLPSDVRTSTLTAAGNPFRHEATKMLSGALEENDSICRRRILNYCEHLRAAYPTRDIDFIRQVFSDYALIIVGHTVKATKSDIGSSASEKVQFCIRSKQQYIEQLTRIFNSGKEIDVKFSNFKIMRHPTMNGIYGVTLRQKYRCGNYNDDGVLFLLWDFRNQSMPLIHVRTWQPWQSINNSPADIIDISDFNLE